MDAISNTSDGSVPHKYSPPIRQRKAPFSLDYLLATDLSEIEDGIRKTLEGINHGNLAIALAFAKIDREALYAQAGCRSYLEYLDTAEDRLNMSRQTMSDYKRIGEIYLTHKERLQRAGFREEGHLHKLRYLPRALSLHPAEEVFSRIARDSLRKFVSFASAADHPDGSRVQQGDGDLEAEVDKIEFDGQGTLRFAPNLNEHSKAELMSYVRRIYEIKLKGNTPYILDLYDDSESRAVERFLTQLRGRR